MTEDPELRIDNGSSHDRSYSKKRGLRTDGNKRIPALLGIMLILIFAGGIFYFITNRPTATDTKGEETLASKIAALEQKVTGLEGQITELQGKSNKGATDPFLLHRVEALAQKVEALEKRAQQPGVESKTTPAPPKPAVTSQKKYHTVQRGETLLKIGKKYGIAVAELRKLNNLSKDQSIRIGQKLLVSVER
jgi:LysM repeat protein